MLNLPIIELHRIVSYIQQISTSTSVIGRTIKIWFRLPQPIMRHAIMTDFPEVNALIITVWRYSPSQNIQAKLQTIAYCVMTWRNWHQSCGIEHSPSNKLNPYIYILKKKVQKKTCGDRNLLACLIRSCRLWITN